MKVLIVVLIAAAAIIAIPLIIALFVKNEYTVKREIIISKPKQQIFDYLKHLKNQEQYNKWVMADPNMKKDYRGTDGQIGFVYAWDGNEQAGKGEQELKALKEGAEVNAEIRFEKPFEGIAHTKMTTDEVDAGQTKVTWSMDGSSKYPMNFMNLFIDGLLGKDLSTSLNNLKTVMEKKG